MKMWAAALAAAIGVAPLASGSTADEDTAARAFAMLRSGKLDQEQARTQVRRFADARFL